MTEEPVEQSWTLAGHMDLRFNAGFDDENTPCPRITWTGFITFGDDVYAITYEPTGTPETHGDTFRFEEIWRIHNLDDVQTVDGVATECGGDGLMWGTDKGEADPTIAQAAGAVLFVDPNGPFDETLTDRRSHWSGDFSDNQAKFAGSFRIG